MYLNHSYEETILFPDDLVLPWQTPIRCGFCIQKVFGLIFKRDNFRFQASKQPSSPPLSSRARSLPPQEKAEKKSKWSKKQQPASTDIDSSSETSSSSTMSRPRGRPAKRKSQSKMEHNDSTESEIDKCDNSKESTSKIEGKFHATPPRGL